MHIDSRPIAFFDSGVGGLPYLEAARRHMPQERYVYLADRAGFPYGIKPAATVIDLATKSIAALVRQENPKALVVACNTATELAIDDIRLANPGLAVIGTVPAIKPAAAMSKARRIGVVATAAAAAASYLTDLAMACAPDCVLVKRGDTDLVNFVEHRFIGSTRKERLAAVMPAVEAMKREGVDVIVLGCTHFLHVAEAFAEAAGPGIAIIDSRQGVAARLASLIKAADATALARLPDAMYLTGAGEFGPVYGGFAERFGLEQVGTLA
jgi:glutamate racemase